MQKIQLEDGEVLELNLGAMSVKANPAKFELVMCERDARGKKLNRSSRVYRGNHAPAVEATLLRAMSKDEKVADVYSAVESHS